MIWIIVAFIAGIAVGIRELYVQWKLKMLEDVILNFPTTTEIAKEVLKVKLPLSEVPPEQLERFKKILQKMKKEPNPDDVDGIHGKAPSYTG